MALSSLYTNITKAMQGAENGFNNIVSNNNNGTLNSISYGGSQKEKPTVAPNASLAGSVRSYSNNVDYAALLQEAIKGGKSAPDVQSLLNQRNSKVSALGLADDPNGGISRQSTEYIKNPVGYDANVDYAALLQDAIKNKKSNSEVRNLLNQRNAKMAGLGLTDDGSFTKQVENYLNSRIDYDSGTDYALEIEKAINRGATAEEIEDLLNKRTQKIHDGGNLDMLNDAAQKKAQDYLSYMKMTDTANSDAEKQIQAGTEEIWAAVAEGSLTLEQGKQALEKTYQEAAKQAYLSNQVANKQAGQKMATLGLGKTGYAPQTYGSISNAYGNALSSATNVKNQGNQDIDNDIANLKTGALTSIAKLKSDTWKSFTDRIYEIENNKKTQENWREQFNQTNKNNQDSLGWGKQQADFEKAMAFLNQGIYSDEIAKMLGISPDEAKAYAASMKRVVEAQLNG